MDLKNLSENFLRIMFYLIVFCYLNAGLYGQKLYFAKTTTVSGKNIEFTLSINQNNDVLLSSNLGVSHMKVNLIKNDPDSIIFSVPIYFVQFAGIKTNEGKKIEGTYSQNLQKVQLVFNEIQQPDLQIIKELNKRVIKVFYKNDTINTLLEYQFENEGFFDLILLLGVAGLNDKDLTIGHHKPFKVLTDSLLHYNYAVLRYDDPGVGGSTGNLMNYSMDDLYHLSLTSLDTIKLKSGLKIRKTIVLGLSEGAIIAGRLNINQRVDYSVLLSRPILEGKRSILQQIQSLGEIYQFDQKTIKDVSKFFNKVSQVLNKKGANNKSVDSRIDQLVDRTGDNVIQILPQYFLPSERLELKQFLKSNYYKSQLNVPSVIQEQSFSKPCLMIYGLNDPFIITKLNIKYIEKIINPYTTKSLLENTNHIMQNTIDGSPLKYHLNDNAISNNVIQNILWWLKKINNNL